MKLKHVFLFFVIFIITMVITSCKKTSENSQSEIPKWSFTDSQTGIKIDYNFQKIVSMNDTSLKVSITITDKSLKQPINYGSILLNSSNVLNKDSLSNILKALYSSLISTYDYQILSRHSDILNQMIKNIRDTISIRNNHSFVYQGLCMFKSLLAGVKRDGNKDGKINFTVFGGYINAINPFVCEEDIVFNIAKFRKYLSDRKLTDKDNIGIDYYLDALQNETANTLNVFEINQRLSTYFNKNTQMSTSSLNFPQGGECGCCGNYSGACYYWNSACLAHDMACQQCQWDLCFGGCVPSSCSGNTIAWYWFIL